MNKHAFPMKALGLGLCLTLALFTLGAWNSWRLYLGFRQIASTEVRLIQLNDKIVHLDEVLTMSARMAAATGDLGWQKRYQKFDPILTATLKEAIDIAPEAYNATAAAVTDDANVKLVNMETRAFELVRAGNPAAANRVLFSDDYEREKRIYAAGMEKSRLASERRVRGRVNAFGRQAVISMILGLVVLALLGGCWLHIVRLIRKYLRARSEAEAALLEVNNTLEARVEERTVALCRTNGLLKDSLDDLRKTQHDLVEASRKAGMADVATTVLHDVGNVLTSVNVSSTLVADRVRESKVSGFFKATQLMKEHQHDLGTFLTADARGRRLPDYLSTVSQHMRDEQAVVLKELESLQGNINHIKAVVSRQQKHAKPSTGFLEVVRPDELVDEAVDMFRKTCESHGITILRDYQPMSATLLDRHRTLQIMLNLLNNARQALSDVAGDRFITVTLRHAAPDRITIDIEDTGCGIAAETLSKLFQHGFTTKPDGHGFGLHSSACLATEMGGSLVATSDGPSRGARFTLGVPLRAAHTEAQEVLRAIAQ